MVPTRANDERRARRSFPADVTSASAARRFVTATLRGWGCDAFVDDAVLLVSELVTNAAVHAQSPAEVVVTFDDGVVQVEVHDADRSHRPVQQNPSTTDPHGRGLLIVDKVATRWSTESTAVGKVVWFVLSVG